MSSECLCLTESLLWRSLPICCGAAGGRGLCYLKSLSVALLDSMIELGLLITSLFLPLLWPLIAWSLNDTLSPKSWICDCTSLNFASAHSFLHETSSKFLRSSFSCSARELILTSCSYSLQLLHLSHLTSSLRDF